MKKRNNSTDWGIEFSNPNHTEIEIETNVVSEKKPSHSKIFNNVKTHVKEYCGKTSLHGLQYAGEEGRPNLERICWLIIFAVCVGLCTYNIMNVWDKWRSKPVIVSFADKPTAIWEIPFPAVTICPEIKAEKKLFNYSEQLRNRNRTIDEEETLQAISLLCTNEKYIKRDNITGRSIIDIFKQVSPPFEDIFLECRWLDVPLNCSIFLTRILTAEGICYTYNILNSSDLFGANVRDHGFFRSEEIINWSLESGYKRNDNFIEYPESGYGIGNMGGIEILLNAFEYDFDSTCRNPTQGFKLWMHSPYEVPQMDANYLFIPTNQKFTMAVKPQMTTTSKKLKAYDISKRQCYLHNEKQLRFYKIYSPDNCRLECIANYILKMCGCVAFSMPHFNDTPICGSSAAICVKICQDNWRRLQVVNELLSEEISEKDEIPDNCDCLPSCTSIDYDMEISQSDFIWKSNQKGFPSQLQNRDGYQLSRVRIFYKNFYFISSHRSELYGPTDFIANCGGLLGLFMGFSFISLIEIIYFCIFRIWGNIAVRRRTIWPFSKCYNSKGTIRP